VANQFSFLKSVNAAFIDDLYSDFQKDPESVEPSWRGFFEGIQFGQDLAQSSGNSFHVDLAAESECAELINAYRDSGRLIANIDPLNETPSTHPLLEKSRFGFSEKDSTRNFQAAKLIGMDPCPLDEIIARLKDTYSSSIGVQFSHITDAPSREWLLLRMEASRNREALSLEDKKFILERLTAAETWETFLHTRYVAKKRFSLEGGEALVPMLDRLIEVGAELGAERFVMGMAHRGRLNVLHNIFGKKAEYIFTEFEELYLSNEAADHPGIGDVKYHMGFSSDITTRQGKKVHLSLGHNPSHLEFISPIVQGIVRSKQRAAKDEQRNKVIPITIHGDAAFAGQGVVYETLNLSQVDGFYTGGTVRLVINNQVGFTTDPTQARSTAYATDVAKMLEVPIFHVNGDDAEAVAWVARLAIEYRQLFKRDVVIDLICYRKYGHNEADEPAFTQPLMYQKIKEHPTPRKIFANKLVAQNLITESEAQSYLDKRFEELTLSLEKAKSEKPKPFQIAFTNQWAGLVQAKDSKANNQVETKVSTEKLLEMAKSLNTLPSTFKANSKLERFFVGRLKAVEEGKGIDWGNGEALAYASLLLEGHPIRFTGQDVERGTFTHRHAVLTDNFTGEKYTPHSNLSATQADFIIRNSTLSETAVLGFEYGWSLSDPNALVIWEAQFGDFANGAQVIIDQFISSSEVKWARSTGIVLLLPHGYEGQGPEHSSARLERFLQLTGDNNLSVCNFTTPANLFHALRRQLKQNFRKPLIVMSPKKLLRYPLAVSELKDFSDGKFEAVLEDNLFNGMTSAKEVQSAKEKIQRVILCSGKIYYELFEERAARKLENIAILRLEEIFPWPAEKLKSLLNSYPEKADLIWAQEEPRNQGAWTFVFNQWAGGLGDFATQVSGRNIRYVGRKNSGVPTSGSEKAHNRIQADIIKNALGVN